MKQYRLYRKNKNGYTEYLVYTGNLKDKPKGWRVMHEDL